MAETKSPRITHLSWGQIDVEMDDGVRHFKDVKLFPGGAREWNWRETGTDHVPGIQAADVDELLEHGAKVIVLSKVNLNVFRSSPRRSSFYEANRFQRMCSKPTRQCDSISSSVSNSPQVDCSIQPANSRHRHFSASGATIPGDR
jgi:hypothetical protein